jgi:hypothetical protein
MSNFVSQPPHTIAASATAINVEDFACSTSPPPFERNQARRIGCVYAALDERGNENNSTMNQLQLTE